MWGRGGGVRNGKWGVVVAVEEFKIKILSYPLFPMVVVEVFG